MCKSAVHLPVCSLAQIHLTCDVFQCYKTLATVAGMSETWERGEVTTGIGLACLKQGRGQARKYNWMDISEKWERTGNNTHAQWEGSSETGKRMCYKIHVHGGDKYSLSLKQEQWLVTKYMYSGRVCLKGKEWLHNTCTKGWRLWKCSENRLQNTCTRLWRVKKREDRCLWHTTICLF